MTGGGSSNPSGVSFPGAYKASDPGIQINIYQKLSTYVAPGPAVISGGTEAVAGKAGSAVTATGGAAQPTATTASTLKTTVKTTSAQAAPTNGGGNGGSCTVAKYGQCGGNGYGGCTVCAAGSTCTAQGGPYYSQCI